MASATAAFLRVSWQLPCPSNKSGSVLLVAQDDPLDLKWQTETVNRAPVAIWINVCINTGWFVVLMNNG